MYLSSVTSSPAPVLTTIFPSPSPCPLSRVECGGEFSVFVSDNGIILTCGWGRRGALGHADSWEDVPTPKLITSLFCESVVGVACGEAHVVAMTADNGLLSWGAGGFGRLGNGSEEDQ